MTKNNKNNFEFYVYSLVLPQSSLTNQPIFQIEAIWRIYSNKLINNENAKTKINLRIQVKCQISKWGVTSLIESFLMKQASNTYKNWIKFSKMKINLFIKNKNNNNTNIQTNNNNNSNINNEINNRISINNNDSPDILSASNIGAANIISRQNNQVSKQLDSHKMDINIDLSSCSHSHNEDTKKIISKNENNTNNVNKDINIKIISNETKNKNNGNKIINNNIDNNNSRGLNKPKAPVSLTIARICARICPNARRHTITSPAKMNKNVRVIVDTKCNFVEKFLWCVIIASLFLILLITLHKYQLY